jgi:spore maturation protein CgeB
MRLVVFGLSVSSAWGNGHATLWRGLVRALDALGHEVIFFEKETTYYAQHRDLTALPGRSRLELYGELSSIEPRARAALDGADAAIVTSYCPDGPRACALALESRAPVRAFYDLDTPITLERIAAGEDVPYLPRGGLGDFDLVLSYTGGRALDALRDRLGARRVAPLYGSVDPDRHSPSSPRPEWRGDCSYLGTYAADRQDALDALFLEPARRRPDRKLVLGGSMYPEGFPWSPNVWYVAHVSPADHPAFYASCPLTVSVTRGPMAAMGHCPSGRLFEAAACGTPVLSDRWEGLGSFYQPGSEILLASTADEALAAMALPHADLARIGRLARERTLDEHTASRRARELIALLDGVATSPRERAVASVHDAGA